MSMPLVALCADEESLRHPELIGLGGENLFAQQWLQLFTSAEQARRELKGNGQVQEVWVVGSDEVAPINLAASLKRDRADRRVCMLSSQESGSLRSRSSAAGIDASLTRQAFVERYALCKQVALQAASAQRSGGGADAASAQGARPLQAAAPPSPPASFAGTGTAGGSASGLYPYAAGQQQGLSGGRPSLGAAGGLTPRAQASQERRDPAKGFLLSVVSGSGGAGKSAVALLAAYAAQSMGQSTLLLDFDLQFGDMAQLMGVKAPVRMDEVLARPDKLDAVRPSGDAPALLAPPEHIDAAEAVVAQAPALIDAVRERFDVIVANTGGAWAEQHAALLERSSKAVFLIDQRTTSIHAAQRAIDLCARCGIAVNPFLFTLNGCGKGAPLSSMDVSCALKGAHVHELSDGGPEVEELLSANLAAELIGSRNGLYESVEQLVAEIVPGICLEQDARRDGSGIGPLRARKPRKRRRG